MARKYSTSKTVKQKHWMKKEFCESCGKEVLHHCSEFGEWETHTCSACQKMKRYRVR